MHEEKQALRRRLLADIDRLTADYVRQSDEGILKNLTDLPQFKAAKTIFTYYSLGREPDTVRLIKLALELGKTVTLPVCFKGGVMEARAIESIDELQESKMHLLEPLESTRVIPPSMLDFVVVPALTFDVTGCRIGRGGGYYDRFLSSLSAFTAGLTREKLLMEKVPKEPHDMPVDCVVTEKCVRFTGGKTPQA